MTEPGMMVFCDDATLITDAEQDRLASGPMHPLVETAFMARSLRIGLMWATHSLASTSRYLLQNTESFFVTRAVGDDLRLLQTLTGMTAEQCESLRLLTDGEAVAYVPDCWPYAVKGRYPYVHAEVSDELVNQRLEAFLARIKRDDDSEVYDDEVATQHDAEAEQESESQEPTRPSLSTRALRLLMTAGFNRWRTVTGLYTLVGMDRRSGRKTIVELEGQGLVRSIDMPSGERGTIKLLALTKQGWEELAWRGLERPKAVTRGGDEHNAVAEAIGVCARSRKEKVQYEYRVGNYYADVGCSSTAGVMLYEIGVTHVDCDKIAALISAQGVVRVVIVLRDRRTIQKEQKQILSQLPMWEQQKVQFCMWGTVIREANREIDSVQEVDE